MWTVNSHLGSLDLLSTIMAVVLHNEFFSHISPAQTTAIPHLELRPMSQHKYVNFTDRVAKICIDPIRRTDQKRNVPQADAESLFRASLERWDELNLATKFTDFSRRATPLAQSLPMVLYNKDKIFDCLESSLRETDVHSSEALFDLLVNLARDLGEDFEPFYPRSLDTCITVIAKFQRDDKSLDVIEHAFNCLAHIFKYLARLLTSNLAPTFDFVLPLFGGDRSFKPRGFVLRFAAESMAFLVRRSSGRDLDGIVNHIIQKIKENPDSQLEESTITLLATTLKGPGTTLHSKTPVLLQTYFHACYEANLTRVFLGIVTEGLHHAREDTAKPIYSAVLESCVQYKGEFSAQCLFVVAGLRKGDRVSNWQTIYRTLLALDDCPSWTKAASAILCYSDMTSSASHLKQILSSLKEEREIFRVMESVHRMNAAVFKAFGNDFWTVAFAHSQNNPQLLALLELDLGQSETSHKIPRAAKFSHVDLACDESSLFDIWWKSLIGFNFDDQKLLESVLNLDSISPFKSNVVAQLLVDGVSEEILLRCCQLPLTPNLLKKISAIHSSYSSDRILTALSNGVFQCLTSCDVKLREAALDLLKSLVKDQTSLLDQCSLINSLPLDLANTRNISLRLRSLVTAYKHTGRTSKESHIASDATIFFFFGMLTVRLQPVSTAVLECIPSLAEINPDLVCRIAYYFISHPQSDVDLNIGSEVMDFESCSHEEFEFNCHTLSAFEKVSGKVWDDSNNSIVALQDRATDSLNFDHYEDLRLLGIKALCQIPKIAEKLVVSQLVPYLLNARDEDGEESDEKDFSFQDRVALLELFAKLSKPEKLPQFEEVKSQYLYFLSSRHSPLQKLGLKCLFTINKPEFGVLRRYRENLDALLDDKRFRDEVTSFISTGKDEMDEGSLHSDDRSAVMPFVVRILYGRAQNNTKRNMRHAVMTSLHFLESKYREMFVSLAHDHLMQSLDSDLDERGITRRVQGYLTLMNDMVRQLKTSAEKLIPQIVQEGIFAIVERNGLSDSKSVRHILNKSLDEMFSSAPKFEIWSPFFDELMSKLIRPQLHNFAIKNLENASAFMKMIQTISNERELVPLLNSEIVASLVSTLSFETVKDSVVAAVLQIVLNLAIHAPSSDITRLAISSVVQDLSQQMNNDMLPETFALAIEVVIKIFELSELEEDIVHNLARTSLTALSKPSKMVPLPVKARVLLALSQIFTVCSPRLLEEAYISLAPLFRQFVSRDARVNLSSCYQVFGQRITAYARVGHLVEELNSFDSERLGEPDFARRTNAFEEMNEQYWSQFNELEWRPLMFNNLFFLRDPEELALRNNGKYAIMRLIESQNASNLVSEYILPAIKKGLRDSEDKYRRLYIDILAQCAHSDVLPTLNVLLYHGDEEADFFVNINHVQVHRRRRAIQRLAKHASELDESVIAHYLISIIEALAMHSGSKNPELNNLADDALHAITDLLNHVSPGQFKSIARRWVQQLVQEPEPARLRKNVRVVTAIAQATPAGLDDFVLHALVSPLHKFMSSKSNEHENLPDRVPIAVATVYFLKSLDAEKLEKELPGKLTALCQMLRSKVPELRDSVRQSLGRIMRVLGSRYLKFVVSELTGALRRGGMQSHVLGFTVHSILAELNRPHSLDFHIGDTDGCAGMIFEVVMDDTFGSIGEEKDSEGYVTAAKEVKQHKSFDTAEILATWTSLSQFGQIISPMRQFLSAKKLTSKVEHKVEEVLKRLAAGLHHNIQASSQDAVILGYEIYMLSEKVITERKEAAEKKDRAENISGALAARIQAAKESEEYFTVRLSSRDWYENGSRWTKEANATKYASSNMHLLQTFALDTLRSVMTSTAGGAVSDSGKGLLTIANVKGLVPIIVTGFQSTHEDLNVAALRLATTAFRLPIPFAEADNTLSLTADRALGFVENSLDTNTLLCQTSLKYLTMLIRSKSEVEIKPGAIAYVLERIRPDLEEPERQSTAVSFVRAVFTHKVLLPQVYDIADTVGSVMVTNQSEHIRVNCRNAYVQFMTTYPLGQSRLDRLLAALAANLRYAAASGRLSVMEAIDSLLQKINASHLEPAFVQFYSNLVLILVSDAEPACRQRAKALLQHLVDADASDSIKEQMANLCLSWLENKNELLLRGGLEVAVLFTQKNIPGVLYERMKSQLRSTVTAILEAGQKSSGESVDWQLLYLALDADPASLQMKDVDGILLFPHPWVRARAARVLGHYFKTTPQSDIPEALLLSTGQKLVRQLGAPRLNSEDSLQIVKDLVFIIPLWDSYQTVIEKDSRNAVLWLVHKLSTMIRTDVSAEDHVGGKTGAIQVLASLPSLLSRGMLTDVAYEVILGLYILSDQLAAEDVLPDLQSLAQEAMGVYDDALGTTAYFREYTAAKQYVDTRRRERRAKRSIEAVAAPELAAQKRMKRNSHKRDVRKQKSKSKRDH